MHVNETVRLESQTKDNLARRLFCEAFQQPWLEEKPRSPGFHLPADSGGRVAGELLAHLLARGCIPAYGGLASTQPHTSCFPLALFHGKVCD